MPHQSHSSELLFVVLLNKKLRQGEEYLSKKRKANLIGHILPKNCLIKRAIAGRIAGKICDGFYEEEGISSHWMTLRKREDAGN
jgi:hypothetical protein